MDTEVKITERSAQSPNTFTGRHIHMVGLGGSGMRALGQMLIGRGAVVSGSDMVAGLALDRLSQSGAVVHVGHRERNIPDDCELVVYSAAIAEQNPELLSAQRRGLEIVKYSVMLGRLMAQGVGIAVSGTHGKSTTTAMVAYALGAAGFDPSFIVGATVEQLGGPSGVGSGRHFVAEACEFDRSFLNLRPQYAAILNVEEDHLDCYADLSAIVEAFRSFSSFVASDGVLVVNGEDSDAIEAARGAACEVQTFGFTERCLWRAVNEKPVRGCFEMDVLRAGEMFGHLSLTLPGRHNAYNALAAIALLHHAGVSPEAIFAALGNFTGVYRRLTLRGQVGGVTVVDDFAHHPTEIIASLRAITARYEPRRLFCVFQPHQHSRTRFLLKDFASSFSRADEVIVPDIYFVRDSEREKDYISSKDLVSQIRLNGGDARYCESFDGILTHLKKSLQSGDVVVTMGAGNIWEVADEIVHWLGRNS